MEISTEIGRFSYEICSVADVVYPIIVKNLKKLDRR